MYYSLHYLVYYVIHVYVTKFFFSSILTEVLNKNIYTLMMEESIHLNFIGFRLMALGYLLAFWFWLDYFLRQWKPRQSFEVRHKDGHETMNSRDKH